MEGSFEFPKQPNRCSAAASPNTGGFTLFEALVVLFALTLATALFASGLRGRDTAVILHGSALQIASGLRATRIAALRTKSSAVFSIDVEGRSYWTDSGQRHSLDPRLSIRVLTAKEFIAMKGIGRVGFSPAGQSTGATITLTLGNASETVTVDWLTGRVTIGLKS